MRGRFWRRPLVARGDRLRRLSGEGGIRTLDERITTRNALAGRRLQPLGHLSRWSLRISDGLAGSRSPAPGTRLPCTTHGGVPERSNGAVSKTVRGASSSRVQIPPPPYTFRYVVRGLAASRRK